MGDSIAELRIKIDHVDNELVRLLNKRADLVLQLAVHKKESGIPIMVPDREAGVLERIQSLNQGPLEEASIRLIYDRIFSVSRQLQRQIIKR